MRKGYLSSLLIPDLYSLTHEGGHFIFSKILGGKPNTLSNFGNTPLIELAEEMKMLPDNGSLSEILGEPMGYIKHSNTGNWLGDALVSAGGHLATFGISLGIGAIGNRTGNGPAKLMASSMGVLQFLHSAKDMITGYGQSDIVKTSDYLNTDPHLMGGIVALAGLTSAIYAWLPEIKKLG